MAAYSVERLATTHAGERIRIPMILNSHYKHYLKFSYPVGTVSRRNCVCPVTIHQDSSLLRYQEHPSSRCYVSFVAAV